MKHVTFLQEMRGVGRTRLVDDDKARALEAEGLIEPNPPDYPAKAMSAAAPPPRRAAPAGKHSYKTK